MANTIDDDAGEWLNPAQAAHGLGTNRVGQPVHPATVVRWIRVGAKLDDGNTLRLRGVKLPGGWRTTRAWLEEFVVRLTEASLGEPSVNCDTPQGQGVGR